MGNDYSFDFSELDAALESLEEEINECNETEHIAPEETEEHSPQTVDELLCKARERMDEEFDDVTDCQNALHAAKQEAERTNSALSDMADAARKYATHEIDQDEHRELITESLNQIRTPVKELQMHLGRNVDPNSMPTNAEISEFKAYVEGYIEAIESRMGEIDPSTVEEEGVEGAEDNDDQSLEALLRSLESELANDSEDDGIELDGEDEDRTDADKFANACESMMIDVTHGHSVRGAVESLLDDLTDFI